MFLFSPPFVVVLLPLQVHFKEHTGSFHWEPMGALVGTPHQTYQEKKEETKKVNSLKN